MLRQIDQVEKRRYEKLKLFISSFESRIQVLSRGHSDTWFDTFECHPFAIDCHDTKKRVSQVSFKAILKPQETQRTFRDLILFYYTL